MQQPGPSAAARTTSSSFRPTTRPAIPWSPTTVRPTGSSPRPASIRPTGLGGILAGSAVDHTASQGALAFDSRHNLLYAVNAGSNTVSVFAVLGDRLALIQVVPSGGTFPVSVAVSSDVVYVLNAENGGALQGYRVVLDHLLPLPGSTRQLG